MPRYYISKSALATSTLLALLFPLLAVAQPTVSAVQTDSKSHSFVHLRWTSSSTPNALRVRYGTTTSYEASAGGGIERAESGGLHTTNTFSVTGLAPSTTYHFCPQSSTDGGSTWSTCVDHVETTDALPAIHPALPEPPDDWDTSYPNTSGYTVRNANCGNLQTHINAAAAAQTTAGSVIVLAAGSVCDSTSYELKSDSAVKSFAAGAVNTTTDKITLNSHGYGEGQAIRLSSANPINRNPAIFPPQNTGLIAGVTYYVRNPGTNDFQLARTVAGTPIDFTTQGTGTHYIRAWPPPSNWIIIASDALADLPPDGVRITPEWASKMVTFKPAGRRGETHQAVFTQAMMQDGTNLAHHYYFRGIEFSTKDTATAESLTTVNPKGHYGHIDVYHDVSHLTFNQCYFHKAAHPNRIQRHVHAGGSNIAFVNSHMTDLAWWFPLREGMAVARTDDTHMTVGAGTYYAGVATHTLTSTATLTLTSGGSVTGGGRVYFAMDGTLTFLIPAGTTGTCAGGGVACSVVVAGTTTPDYPINGESRLAGSPIADITFSSGTISNALESASPFKWNEGGAVNDFWESSSNILGLGPGPYKIQNTYAEGVGIPFHFDDAMNEGDGKHRGYILYRNRFVYPTWAITNHPDTNNLRYPSRHIAEWKTGTHISVVGNSFENSPYDGTTVAVPLVIMPQTKGLITDVRVAYNLFSGGAGGVAVMGQSMGYPQESVRKASPPVQRVLVEHNIFDNFNSYLYKGNRTSSDAPTAGYVVDARSAIEDYIVRNNTAVNLRGPNTFFIRTQPHPVEGISVTDNVMTVGGENITAIYAGAAAVGSVPTFTGSAIGKNGMDQMWRRGVGVPSYVFSGNALIPWYSDAVTPAGIVSAATQCANFGGTLSGGSCVGGILAYIATGANVEANSTAMKLFDAGAGDLRKRIDSPFISGAGLSVSGLGIGADWDENRRQRGEIYNVRALDISSSGASIHFTAPDPGAACYVGYGTSADRSTWVWTPANTTNDRPRGIALTGLNSETLYRYTTACDGTAQTDPKTFTTL